MLLDKLKIIISPVVNLSRNVSRSVATAVIPKEEKIKIKEYTINYVKVGNGAHKVLFLPGALGTIWTEGRPLLKGFDREKFTLITWDPPGYGKSRPPEKKFTTDFFEKDADIAYDFMKALNIPKFSLMGFSDGGITGLILASKYPEALNKLVVWSSKSFILPHELEAYKKMKDISNWSKRMRDPLIEIYGKELFRKYCASVVDIMEAIFNKNDGNICSERLKDIKCPTFVLCGQNDPLVDPVHISHLHTHIDGSRMHLYPEGKHNIHLKYAEDFNKRVQEFLLQP